MIPRHLALVHPAEGCYCGAPNDDGEEWNPANLDDVWLVHLPVATERKEYPEEHRYEKAPEGQERNASFLRFINARNLGDMLSALDECFEQHKGWFFPSMSANERLRPVQDVEPVATAFYGSNPTATQRKHVGEVLKTWGFIPSAPETWIDGLDNIVYAYRLGDVIQAQRELYNHGLLLAYCSGKPEWDADFLSGDLFEDDKKGLRFPLIDTVDASADSLLALSHQEQLFTAPLLPPGESLRPFDTFGGGAMAYEAEMKKGDFNAAVMGYAEGVFNVLARSGSYPLLRLDVDAKGRRNASNVNRDVDAYLLYQMWWLLKEGIPKEPGEGAITVCRHCKRLFMQTTDRSKSKEYCSGSCRVMEHRKRHGQDGGSGRKGA